MQCFFEKLGRAFGLDSNQPAASRGVKDPELGAFAHNAKHYIMICEELVHKVKSSNPELRERAISRLHQTLQRMLLETNTVLLADKDDSGLLRISPMPISLTELVNDAVAEQKIMFESANVKIEPCLDVGVPESSLDPAVFPHVIHNLLDNALKYSSPGGEVRVCTRASGKDTVILEIVNGGQLFDSAEASHLFSRHYRGANAERIPGTGLGLYLVKRVVEAHAGEVHAERIDGEHVKFTVKLPVLSEGSSHVLPR